MGSQSRNRSGLEQNRKLPSARDSIRESRVFLLRSFQEGGGKIKYRLHVVCTHAGNVVDMYMRVKVPGLEFCLG